MFDLEMEKHARCRQTRKYPIVTNPQPVAIRMIGEFLDTLAIRKINQRLDFSKNFFAHGGSLDFLNLLKRFGFPVNIIHTYYYKLKISVLTKNIRIQVSVKLYFLKFCNERCVCAPHSASMGTSTTPMVSRSSRVCMGSLPHYMDTLGRWFTKESLNYSKLVIPAKAGIQKNQRTGHRLSPV